MENNSIDLRYSYDAHKEYNLFDLLYSYSASGCEENATTQFEKIMKKIENCKFEFKDKIGNVAFSMGKGTIPVMISAHIDEIGIRVQYIDDNGFIYFIKNGGIDPKALLGSVVTIKSNKDGQMINGVIGKTPIHIEKNSDNKDIKISDLKIDCGFENKEDAEKYVRVGDTVTFRHYAFPCVNKNRIVSNGIDDKIGVFVITKVFELLNKINYEFKTIKPYGVACVQEEVGGGGAEIAAKRINPQYSIDYDVTFATDDECVSKKEWGDIKLGKGGAIAFGPDKNTFMCNDVIELCKKNSTPYQIFSVGAKMTNTHGIKNASDDCATMLISIPQRNMHTQVEMCDLRDIKSIVNMTVDYLLYLDENISHENKHDEPSCPCT